MNKIVEKAIMNFRLIKVLKAPSKSVCITVLIPPAKDIMKYSAFFESEIGQAINIKNKTHRLETIDALQKLQAKIRNSRTQFNNSTNGMAFFVNESINLAIEPASMIGNFLYKCDKKFEVDSLSTVVKKANFGLIVLDRDEASIGLYNGEEIVSKSTFESNVPGQTKKGGQSAMRYSRIRETETLNFYYKISMAFTEIISGDYDKIKEVFIGGLYPCADEFCEGKGSINPLLKKKIKRPYFTVMDTNYAGLRKLLFLSKDIIAETTGNVLRAELDLLKKKDIKDLILTNPEEWITELKYNRRHNKIHFSSFGIANTSEEMIQLFCESNLLSLGEIFDSSKELGKEFDAYFTNGIVIEIGEF